MSENPGKPFWLKLHRVTREMHRIGMLDSLRKHLDHPEDLDGVLDMLERKLNTLGIHSDGKWGEIR